MWVASSVYIVTDVLMTVVWYYSFQHFPGIHDTSFIKDGLQFPHDCDTGFVF
jgi:hypothetical protein